MFFCQFCFTPRYGLSLSILQVHALRTYCGTTHSLFCLSVLCIDGIESVKYLIHCLWVYARARASATCDCDNVRVPYTSSDSYKNRRNEEISSST